MIRPRLFGSSPLFASYFAPVARRRGWSGLCVLCELHSVSYLQKDICEKGAALCDGLGRSTGQFANRLFPLLYFAFVLDRGVQVLCVVNVVRYWCSWADREGVCPWFTGSQAHWQTGFLQRVGGVGQRFSIFVGGSSIGFLFSTSFWRLPVTVECRMLQMQIALVQGRQARFFGVRNLLEKTTRKRPENGRGWTWFAGLSRMGDWRSETVKSECACSSRTQENGESRGVGVWLLQDVWTRQRQHQDRPIGREEDKIVKSEVEKKEKSSTR